MMDQTTAHKTMVMVAPNGARRQKSDHPNIPLSATDLADEALRCANAGASAIHLHVRDENGGHVLDADLYRQAIEAVRNKVGDRINIQITTEAVGIYTPEQQMAVVRDVVPDAVSIALKEIIPQQENEAEAKAFFIWMQENNVSPQFILYEGDEVTRFFDLQKKGVIPFAAPFLLFVLGRYAVNQQSEPADLNPFIKALDGRQLPWAVCAFGGREAECAAYASSLGGHVRVGFENNLYLPGGDVAERNSDIVAATVKAIAEFASIMDAGQARGMLNTCLR